MEPKKEKHLIRKFLVLMAAVAILAGLVGFLPAAAQEGPSASRSLPSAPTAGSEVTVTITANGFGAFADVVETLPSGFTYLRSSLPSDQVDEDGQTVTFSLLGATAPATFTYTVRAPSTGGTSPPFSGVFSGVELDFTPFSGVDVGGVSSIVVADPSSSGPSASRSLPSAPTAGSEVTVTITANGFGAFADVVETLPSGFTYLRSSLPSDQVDEDGQTVTFSLLGATAPATFTYTVRAPSTGGTRACSH